MKKMLLVTILLITAAMFVVPAQISAQDILDVEVLPPGNINTVINGDTLAGGLRAHPDRIYRLKRGAIYQVTEPLRINGNLTVIAADVDGDPAAAANRPPVLAPAILTDNSSVGGFFDFIGEGAKVELSDLYLLAVRADQNWLGWGEGITVRADHISLKMRRVIMEGWSNVAINPAGQWHKIDIQDCYFRNNQHTGSWFGGQVMRGSGGVASDTIIFKNNTFFSNSSYLFDVRGFDKLSVFEHNTCVYGVVNPFLIRQASNLHMKNNLFYSMHAFGGNPTHVADGWFLNYPDTASSTIWRIRGRDSVSYWSQLWGSTISGPEAFVNDAVGATIDLFNPANRVTEAQNNAYHFPAALNSFIDAYNDTTTIADSIGLPVMGGTSTKALVRRTIKKSGWISEYAQWTLDELLPPLGTTIMHANNDDMDPGFGTDVTDHLNKLTGYIQEISTGKIDEVTWHYLPASGNLYPPTWPLPENLAYTNAAMQGAGTDGFALGDLNWFPSQKAEWLTGVEKVGSEIPNNFELGQNYPNPFNPTTNIDFKIANTSSVKLVVYNILGQRVKTLVNENLKAGNYQIVWNGLDDSGKKVASGNYLLSLETDAFRATRKMVLLK
ncbi:MAG: FlgD immunoglobulin-like domain containing protein [Melioribacteraceae bacterium]